jgi:hypothetical protein
MDRAVSQSEHQHVQVFVNIAKGLVAPLVVVFAGVLHNQRTTPVKVLRQREWQTAILLIADALGWVGCHSHSNYCIHVN